MSARRALSALIVFAVALAISAQIRTVNHVAMVVKPARFTGPCPETVTFIATIFVNRHPSRVTYEWIRSDGARSPRQTVDISSAGRGVEDTWTLGAQHEHMRVWEQLHVLAPTGISSPRGVAVVTCR